MTLLNNGLANRLRHVALSGTGWTKEKGVLNYREHHLLMPGVSCGGSGGRYLDGKSAGTPVSAARWSVPIDETHTILFRVRYKPEDNPGDFWVMENQ